MGAIFSSLSTFCLGLYIVFLVCEWILKLLSLVYVFVLLVVVHRIKNKSMNKNKHFFRHLLLGYNFALAYYTIGAIFVYDPMFNNAIMYDYWILFR